MATARQVPRGQNWHGQLAASVADDLTFADEIHEVEILTDGTAAVWVTTDGSDAAVPATNSGSTAVRIPATGAWTSTVLTLSGSLVSLISAGTPVYSVHRAS